MHICFIVLGLIERSPYGEEKFTVSLAKWLQNHEYSVTVIGRGGLLHTKIKHNFETDIQSRDKNRLERDRPKSSLYRYISYSFSLILSLLFIINILLTNSKHPIDIIHAQDTGYAGLAGVIASKLLKIPVILSSHGIRHKGLRLNLPEILKTFRYDRLEYYLDIFTIRHSDKIIAVNPFVKEYFERITGKTIDFLPIPINVKDFTYSEFLRKMIRGELGIKENTIAIGFIGRLSSEKNIITLLYSFIDISKENPNLKLIIVGEGHMKKQLQNIVTKNDINDKVVFCGLRHDIAKILCGLDIFVLPSYTEGLSTSLLESMASERAIVSSDIPANRQLVEHNKEALLVDPNNKDEFNLAIKELCKNQSLRIKLGHNARIKSNSFDKEVIFPILAEYYDKIKNKYS